MLNKEPQTKMQEITVCGLETGIPTFCTLLPTVSETASMCCTRPNLTTEASVVIAINTLSNYCNSAGTSAQNSHHHIVISSS